MAPTLTCATLLIMIMGQLASFGLPWWRRAGRQTRDGVTPVSAIVTSACVRPSTVQRLIGRHGCGRGQGSSFLVLPRRRIVRRCSPRSTSLSSLRCGRSRLTAAARDGVGAIEESRAAVRPSGLGCIRTGRGPSRRRSCWRGGHRAADHPALLTAGPQLLAITPGRRIAAPCPIPRSISARRTACLRG